jgi:hypothetical protein
MKYAAACWRPYGVPDMNKHIGANTRKKHSDRRHRLGNAVTKAARKGAHGSRILALLVLVIGGASYGALKIAAWMKHSPIFTVSSISVEGTVRIDSTDVLRVSGIKTGTRIMDIDPRIAAKAIMKNPWVKSAAIVRHFPHGVVIRIKERIPLVLVSAGTVYYADDAGMLMPLFPGTYSNLPLVTGLKDVRLDSVKCVGKASFERVKRFLDQCKAVDFAFAKRVSQIDFSGDPVVRISLDDMPVIIEMNDADTRTSVARLRHLLESVRDETRGAPRHINLCYENLAYLQW